MLTGLRVVERFEKTRDALRLQVNETEADFKKLEAEFIVPTDAEMAAMQEEEYEAVSEGLGKMSAALARLRRLRKMKEAAEKRYEKLFVRCMADLDEEDGTLAPDVAQERVANDKTEWGATEDVEWTLYGFEPGSPPQLAVYPQKERSVSLSPAPSPPE